MEEDQKLVVMRVLRNGRRRYDPASKARLVAACLEPGVSVSRLALDNGINANLLRKWIKAAQEAGPERRSSPSAFVPVVAEDCSRSRDLGARRDEMRLANSERPGSLSSPFKVSASLPNGVKLTLECGDPNALSALIGELSNVPTGR
ncbi:MAG: transposase [Alphaproteobacteria bacterium]|uniref:IS66-like element accessory protein TnpA n=1 Tax=Roseibium sp. TaxID=1936156 RepID=UPI003263C861